MTHHQLVEEVVRLTLQEADAHFELRGDVDVLVVAESGADEGAVVGADGGDVGPGAVAVGGLAVTLRRCEWYEGGGCCCCCCCCGSRLNEMHCAVLLDVCQMFPIAKRVVWVDQSYTGM